MSKRVFTVLLENEDHEKLHNISKGLGYKHTSEFIREIIDTFGGLDLDNGVTCIVHDTKDVSIKNSLGLISTKDSDITGLYTTVTFDEQGAKSKTKMITERGN